MCVTILCIWIQMGNGLHLYSAFLTAQYAVQYVLTFTRSYTQFAAVSMQGNSSRRAGNSQLSWSSKGEVSCSGTPQLSARRSRGPNRQPSCYQPTRSTSWATCRPDTTVTSGRPVRTSLTLHFTVSISDKRGWHPYEDLQYFKHDITNRTSFPLFCLCQHGRDGCADVSLAIHT